MYSAEVFEFEQGGHIREKGVVFEQTGCVREGGCIRTKVVVFG